MKRKGIELSNPVIEVDDLCKQVTLADGQGELQILQDIRFAVGAGESVAIVGASGSGKSTLLGLLAGLDVPARGTVRVQGMPDSFPLFLPTKVAADLRRTEIRLDHNGLHVNSIPDPVHAAMEAKADSLREALGDRIEARSDSVDDLRSRADELEAKLAQSGRGKTP